eukprot:10018323-Alexandrium_andersonii.AAC.1
MAVDSLLFRTRAVRSQANSARLGASHSGIPFRAHCSVAVAIPPKGDGQSPGGDWQVAGSRRSR